MTSFIGFLSLGCLLFAAFNLVVMPFSRGRRWMRLRLALAGLAGLLVMGTVAGHFSDRDAIAEGFLDVADRREASTFGITDPEVWRARKPELITRRDAERKAEEKAQKHAAEVEAKEAAARDELARAEAKAREEAAALAEKAKADACRKDIHCWGEKGWPAASINCPPAIERLAKWDFEWTDRWSETKLDRYRWKDPEAGIVTYLGDKIKMQNGFGAWKHVSYSCDFDPVHNIVLDVVAYE